MLVLRWHNNPTHLRLLPWWSGSCSLSPFYLQFGRTIETWMVSSSKITLCYFPDEEIGDYGVPPKNLSQVDSAQYHLLTLVLVFLFVGTFPGRSCFRFQWIFKSDQHTENFRQVKWKPKCLWLRFIAFHYHSVTGWCNCSSFKVSIDPGEPPPSCQSCVPLRGLCQQRFLIHHTLSGNSYKKHWETCRLINVSTCWKSLCLQAYGMSAEPSQLGFVWQQKRPGHRGGPADGRDKYEYFTCKYNAILKHGQTWGQEGSWAIISLSTNILLNFKTQKHIYKQHQRRDVHWWR